jgi:hypothetical protein
MLAASPVVARRRALPDATLAPGLVMFAAVPLLGALGGGYATGTWSLAGLFALALLVLVLALAPPPRGAPGGPWRGALLAYGAFCAWNYLSILWADVPGDAWEGANRTLLYGVVVVLVGLRPWPRDTAVVALGVTTFGTGALAAGVLAWGAVVGPGPLLLEGRLAAPTGYANATAALWLIALWPALHLATQASPALPWRLRAAALATAALLLETALLSQSRGALAGFSVAAATYLLLAPRRGRAALALAVLLALAAATWGPLTAVREAATTEAAAGALARAQLAIATSAAIALIAWAWIERRAEAGGAGGLAVVARAGRVARRAAPIATVALLAAVAAFGHPAGWAAARWQDFKSSGYGEIESHGSRFSGSLGSNRYDFYRVAVAEFRAHPVLGIGADNFAVPYLEQRRRGEAPRYPHSLGFRLLAQLGAPGTALFLAFGGFALAAVCRRRRSAPDRAAAGAAAVAGCTVWLAQGMVDWLWEFPALSVGAFALLALAAAPDADAAGPARTRLPQRLRAATGALVAVACAISLALGGAAAHAISAARASADSDPALAVTQLRWAAQLDPLSARPLILESLVARRAGLGARARVALDDALRREPRNWFAHLERALLHAQDGRRAAALRDLATATDLNPRQPVLAGLREHVRRGETIDPGAVEARIARQLATKLRPAGAGR